MTPEQIGSKTGTYGVPEFGTKFVRQMLEETHPTNDGGTDSLPACPTAQTCGIGNAQEIINAGIAPCWLRASAAKRQIS